VCSVFLKKGILFSLEWGDVTLFALGLGERWLAGISFSSASKPVASMSIADDGGVDFLELGTMSPKLDDEFPPDLLE